MLYRMLTCFHTPNAELNVGPHSASMHRRTTLILQCSALICQLKSKVEFLLAYISDFVFPVQWADSRVSCIRGILYTHTLSSAKALEHLLPLL